MARRYHAAVLVCGASLLAYLILSIGPATVLASFRELSWRLLLEAIGVVGFVAVQMRGAVAGGYGILGRLGFSGGPDVGKAATHVDRALAAFYRQQPRRLALSLACNLLGWITRAAEVWLVLYLL